MPKICNLPGFRSANAVATIFQSIFQRTSITHKSVSYTFVTSPCGILCLCVGSIDQNSAALLSNCAVEGSGDDGIRVSYNSSARLYGTIESSGNARRGIHAFSNSGIICDGADVEAIGNSNYGVKAGLNSNIFFYNSNLDSIGNKSGIVIHDSSSMLVDNGGDIEIIDNLDDGLRIVGNSRLNLSQINLSIKSNDKNGMSINGGSSAYFNGSVFVEDNENRGVHIGQTSTMILEGTMDVLRNHYHGVIIMGSSYFHMTDSGSLTVSDTSGGAGVGIAVIETSTFRATGGLLVQNSTGDNTPGHGIDVYRSSALVLKARNPEKPQIINNNQGCGVHIVQNASGRFENGTNINHNGSNGITVGNNSQIFVTDNVLIKNNVGNGIRVYSGGTMALNDSTVQDNTGTDIDLSSGAVVIMDGNTYDTITCDSTVVNCP
jgi:hypothetical protein